MHLIGILAIHSKHMSNKMICHFIQRLLSVFAKLSGGMPQLEMNATEPEPALIYNSVDGQILYCTVGSL